MSKRKWWMPAEVLGAGPLAVAQAGGQGGSELAFSKAKILVEFNASAEDVGVQVLLESVRLVFKNLPLDTACNRRLSQQLHPFACRAALLARCAGARPTAPHDLSEIARDK